MKQDLDIALELADEITRQDSSNQRAKQLAIERAQKLIPTFKNPYAQDYLEAAITYAK